MQLQPLNLKTEGLQQPKSSEFIKSRHALGNLHPYQESFFHATNDETTGEPSSFPFEST